MAFDEQAFERDFFGKSASGKGGLPAVGVTEGRAAGFDEAAFEREFFGGGGQGVQAPQDVGGLPQVHVDGGLDAGEVERTEGSEGLAGGLAEFGRGLARGVVGLPEMLGKTAQFAGRQVGGAEEEELGSGLAAIGEEAEEAAPWLRESREGAGRESPLSLRGQAYESGRTVAESLGPAALGAGVGFAVGGPVGAAVGAGVGFFGAIPLFAGAQGEETYERTYAHQRKQGLSEGEAHDEALKAGWINAAIEGGGELAADVVTAGAARFLPRGVKGDLVRALASNKGAYWRAVKDISTKVLPAEMATEMGQALGQQYVESEYAGAERPGLDTALEVVIPTLILSGLAGGGAHTVGGLRRAEVSRALSDPGADMQARLRAADIVEAELQGQDPELAGIWRAHTDQSLFAGRPVVAEEDAFYRDWNETASRQREAGKQEDEVAGDAEQEQEAAQFDGTVRAPEGAREGAGEMPVAKGGVGVPAGGPEGERAEVAGEAALEQALIEQEAALAGQAGLEAQLPDRVSQALAAQPGGAQAENAMAGAFADAARTVDSPQSEIDFDPETGEIFNYPDPVYADAADYAEMDAPGDRWFQDLIQEAVESGVPESSLSALEKVHDKFDPPVVEDEVRVLIEEVKNARASTERVRGEAEEGVAEYRQEPVEEAAAPSQKQPEVGPRAEEAAVTSPPAGPSEAQVEAGAVVGAGFAPTHRSADGALLQATDEPGVYVDRDGAEVEDGYAQAVGVAGQAVAVGAVEPTSSEAAESVTEVESQGGESVSSATQGANIVPTVLASDGEARTSRKALSEALKTDDARWAALKAAGADDRSLSQAIAEHFGSEGVAGADWKATGGRQAAVGKGLPMFTFGGKTLTGQSVVRRARRILGIREKAEERLDKTKTARAVIKAESEAATSPENALPEPTQAQKVAGNYKKGHVNLHGLDISIENPRGSERSGTDRAGKPWVVEMKSTYGYIKGTRGKDKDQIDVFLGTQAENAELPVFVVDQVAPDTGAFDEHKVLMGFPNKRAARRGYVANYEKGWKGAGAITPMSMDEFKQWLESGNTTKPVDAKVSERAPTRIEQARAGETPAISAQGAAEKPEEVRGEKAEPVVGAKRDDGGLKTRAELKKTQNTVFTDEAAKRALAVLRSKLGQLSSGLDPEMMQAGLTLAGHTIESGARSFAAYAGAMTELSWVRCGGYDACRVDGRGGCGYT